MASIIGKFFYDQSWSLNLYAAVYGFGHGGLWVLFSPLVAELFGIASHGALFGVVYFVITLGGTIDPLLAGYIFDLTGSYQVIFSTCFVLSAIAIVLATCLTPTTYTKAQSQL
ncbi:MFS transporter [Chloroflexota bacterium]